MKKKSVKRKKAQIGTITNQIRPRQDEQNYNWMDTDDSAFPAIPGITNPINQMPITAQGTDTGQTANAVPLNPDGSYSFLRTEGTGNMQDNPYVTGFNALATGVTGIANTIENNRLKKREQMQMVEANQPRYWENMEGAGLNNLPMYTKYGGKTGRKYRVGGGGPSMSKAKEMLRDGTVNGKPITEQQRKYFGWIAGGKKQTGGTTYASQNQINAANLEAKRLTKAKGLISSDETYVAQNIGDPVVQYIDTATGLPSTKPVKSLAKKLPSGVTMADIQQNQGIYWYDDPQTGYPVELDPSIVNLPKFRKNSEDILLDKVERDFSTRQFNFLNNKSTSKLSFQTGGDPAGYHTMPDGSLMSDDEMSYENGMPTGQVEAEQGEIVEGTDGNIAKISDTANRHEKGGVKLSNVSRVLEDTSDKRKDRASKMLKIAPEEMEGLFGFKPKGSVSHSKAFELATKHYDGKRDKINNNNKLINDRTKIDKYGAKSAELNFKTLQDIPTQEDVYDALFLHQETVKEMNNIQDDGSVGKHGGKYNVRGRRVGTHKAQAGTGINPYQGGRTPAGRTTPTGNPNTFNFPGGLDAYKSAWSPILDLSQYDQVGEAQQATYNYLVQNQPDVAANIWQTQGLTQKGRDMMNPKSKSYDPAFARVAGNVFDNTGKLKQGVQLTPDQLQVLTPAYSDDMLGVRAVTPSQTTTTATQTTPETTAAPAPAPRQPLDTSVNVNPNFIRQPENRFREGMYWDELAAPLMNLVEGREAELYNPVQLNQLRYKLLDPTAAMNANQADFNAALEGADPATAANLLAQKYSANAQISANYENQNVGIKNREIDYNTGVRDRQSAADAGTRATYHRNVQLARENQRQQRLKAIEDISRAVQMKRRQNKSGNLILKLSPAFDQSGEYNDYQYAPILPTDLGISPQLPTVTPPKKTSSTKTTTTWRLGDRTIKTENKQ